MSLETPASLQQLIQQCAESNNSGAWSEFVSRFHRPIALSVLRTTRLWGAPPQQVIEDLVQETYLKLCANRCASLLEFARHHPEAITGYIKTIAVNVTHDYFKSRHSQKRGSGNAEQPMDDLESTANFGNNAGPDAIEREVLLRQVQESLNACSGGPDQVRDRAIFWLYYRQGLTANDIAALPRIGLSAKGVESVIHRLTSLVRAYLLNRSLSPGAKHAGGEKGQFSAESF